MALLTDLGNWAKQTFTPQQMRSPIPQQPQPSFMDRVKQIITPANVIRNAVSVLPGGQLLGNQLLKPTVNKYIQNRYVEPVKNIPNAFNQTFSPKSNLLTRGQGALGLLGGAATLVPDPVQDVAMPIYDLFKGTKAYQLANQGKKIGTFEALTKGGLPALTMEKPVGLGESLTSNKTGQMVGNLAELPLLLATTHKFTKKLGPKLLDEDVKEIGAIANRASRNWKTVTGAADIKQMVKDENLINEIFMNKYKASVSDLKKVSLIKKVNSLYGIAMEDYRGPYRIQPGFSTKELKGVKQVVGEDKFIAGLEADKAKAAKKLPNLMYKIKQEPKYTPPSEFKRQKNVALGISETQPKTFDDIFAKWIGKRESARTVGVETGAAVNIPKTVKGSDVISYIEGSKKNVSPEVKQAAATVRKQFDDLYKYAQKSGIDIGYMKDYVTHIWKEDPAAVSQAYKTASKRFGFAGNRSIPTYEEGIKMGLTPKFSDPRQLIAEYSKKLETTKANIEFINNLKEQGLIVQKRLPGFQPITGVGFQSPSVKIGENVIREGNYYAPPRVANLIDKVFSPNESPTWLRTAAKSSGVIQDIGLSGGIPKTPINAWTVAQMQKEILAGRIKGPFKSLFTSLTTEGSNNYFKENSQFIKEQQLNNIPISTSFNTESLANRTGLSKFFNADLEGLKLDKGVKENMQVFRNNFKKIWGATVNEPTFKRFMPTLQTEFYKDARNTALKAGKSEAEAIQIATKATKNFYGLTSTDATAKQSKIGHDVIQTLFFAPKYRQSMVNFWVNNIKSLKNPLAIENRANAKFLVGSLLTYLAYDKVNQFYTGRHMSENPPGKEDKVLIPLGDGFTMGVPFLSSIATMPRTAFKIGKDVVGGNLPGAIKEAKGFLSMGLKTPLDIATNEDYFGGQIYEPGSKDQLKDITTYASGAYGHPYIREMTKYLQGKQPLYQTVSKMMELPLRYYKDSSIASGYYYQSVDDAKKGLSPADSAILSKWIAKKPEGQSYAQETTFNMAEALEKLSRPDLLKREAQIKIQTALKNKQSLDPFYLLPPEQQQTLLRLQTFYPGDKQKTDLTNANIEWLKPYWTARTAYFDELIAKGIMKPTTNTNNFVTPPDIQKKLDTYYSLPYGTGERTVFIKANPDLVDYWNAKAEDTNAKRAQLGLAPVSSGFSSGGFGGFGNFKKKISSKKITFKKIKVSNIKAKKLPKLKIVKAPKLKAIKIKKVKNLLTIKPIKSIFRIKA